MYYALQYNIVEIWVSELFFAFILPWYLQIWDF